MTPEAGRPSEISQNEIGQTLQRYIDSDEFSQHARSRNTWLAYKDDLSHFGVFCQNNGIASTELIQSHHVNKWFEQLETQGFSPSTINRRRSGLSGFFDWAVIKGLLPEEIALVLPKWKERSGARSLKSLTDDQAYILLETAKTKSSLRDAVIISIALKTGAKGREIMDLNLEDIIETKNHKMKLRFNNIRKNQSRTVLLDKELKKLINNYIIEENLKPGQPLFTKIHCKNRLTRQGFWLNLQEYKNTVRTDELTLTILRNTYFENLARQEKKPTQK